MKNIEIKKLIITDLMEAWVAADILLEKIDKMRDFFSKYCHEGGMIPCADTLRQCHLKEVFDSHIMMLKNFFESKCISIIIDETTDSRGRSVVNTLFFLSPSYKIEYNQLESDSTQNQQITLKLMLLPVSSCWNSWLKTAIYVCNYLEYIQGFCKEENEIETNEKIFLKSGTTNLQFGEEINTCLNKYQTQIIYVSPVFQDAFKTALKKFDIYLLNHPCRSLFKSTQIFDPKFVSLAITNRDLYNYTNNIPELFQPSTDLFSEWLLYSLDYIWLPISSCAVERSFSAYNNILQDNRQNLSTESLKMLTILYFNKTKE
ncbi:transcription factor e2f6 [Gigaspora margarita]|uniref:Transcription factor e2f6 n=1 Tax=Gigaspora margarita TaxID=4874 RepID=A0A8H3XJX6_GIGMA|nr:transcription factor e2f6 [Gigaspora margarita]